MAPMLQGLPAPSSPRNSVRIAGRRPWVLTRKVKQGKAQSMMKTKQYTWVGAPKGKAVTVDGVAEDS